MSVPIDSLRNLLTRSSVFVDPSFEPCEENIEDLTENTRVLVVGAGGLGCEILKDLALSGFTDIHVIDLDTVDVSNLNRQFLFRMSDVNRYKSEVAAEFIMKRCPHVKVKAHTKPIQDFDPKWYTQFDIVIAGLDNIPARQWLNETLVDLVQYDNEGNVDFESVIPLIDGGTEGFAGQSRLFLPRITSCFECSLASLPPQQSYAICTIRNVPRIPEHCIVYAYKVMWPKLIEFTNSDEYKLTEITDVDEESDEQGVPLDKDNIEHMTWIFKRAAERAEKFGITGVTYKLTMQVVKNIIPAIASTNALISAACVNEALKWKTKCSYHLDNYYMYIGATTMGINTETIKYERNPECAVCHKPYIVQCQSTDTIQQLIRQLEDECKLSSPSIMIKGRTIYATNLHTMYESNLNKSIMELAQSNSQINTFDKNGKVLKVVVQFSDQIQDEEDE